MMKRALRISARIILSRVFSFRVRIALSFDKISFKYTAATPYARGKNTALKASGGSPEEAAVAFC